jgi:hypothetical protein
LWGGLGRGFWVTSDLFLQRDLDLLNDLLELIIQHLIAKANDPKALALKPYCATRVVCSALFFNMLWPVKFDDEPMRKANEIHNVFADSGLTAKLQSQFAGS